MSKSDILSEITKYAKKVTSRFEQFFKIVNKKVDFSTP